MGVSLEVVRVFQFLKYELADGDPDHQLWPGGGGSEMTSRFSQLQVATTYLSIQENMSEASRIDVLYSLKREKQIEGTQFEEGKQIGGTHYVVNHHQP